MNNPACSTECAGALTSYGNTGRTECEPQVTVTEGDRGFLASGRTIDPEYADQIMARGGGINIFSGLAEEGAATGEEEDGGG